MGQKDRGKVLAALIRYCECICHNVPVHLLPEETVCGPKKTTLGAYNKGEAQDGAYREGRSLRMP